MAAQCNQAEEARCNPASNTCESCQGNGDCAHILGKPECVAGTCVQCTKASESARCTEVDKKVCDSSSNTCVQCTAATEALACDATNPICDVGTRTCVRCSASNEATLCGANSCVQATGKCSDTPRDSVGVCQACEADSECTAGLKCVEHLFGGTSVGTYCTLEAVGGCADTVAAARPYSRTATLTSVDGVVGDYCLPPAATTCRGVADATLQKSCVNGTTGDNALCGEPNVPDGVCLESGPAAGKCSYGCTESYDCPDFGLTKCPAMPSFCQP
jgi:hypothetical protein